MHICPGLSFDTSHLHSEFCNDCATCLNTTVHAHVSPSKTALKAAFNHECHSLSWAETCLHRSRMIDWQDNVWFAIWFSTDTGASCSRASLGEPSAVVTSGMRPAVTAPHLVWGKHSVDRISSAERQVSSMPTQQQLRLSNTAHRVGLGSCLQCRLLTVG